MVDNIKVNIPLAAVSSAKSVKPVDYRQNSNRNNLFKIRSRKGRRKRREKIECK